MEIKIRTIKNVDFEAFDKTTFRGEKIEHVLNALSDNFINLEDQKGKNRVYIFIQKDRKGNIDFSIIEGKLIKETTGFYTFKEKNSESETRKKKYNLKFMIYR